MSPGVFTSGLFFQDPTKNKFSKYVFSTNYLTNIVSLNHIAMITTRHIRLHSKCLKILAMMQTVDNRIASARADLRRFDHVDGLSPLRLMYDRKDLRRFDHVDGLSPLRLMYDRKDLEAIVDHNLDVKHRLVQYYANTTMQIFDKVIIHSQTIAE